MLASGEHSPALAGLQRLNARRTGLYRFASHRASWRISADHKAALPVISAALNRDTAACLEIILSKHNRGTASPLTVHPPRASLWGGLSGRGGLASPLTVPLQGTLNRDPASPILCRRPERKKGADLHPLPFIRLDFGRSVTLDISFARCQRRVAHGDAVSTSKPILILSKLYHDHTRL